MEEKTPAGTDISEAERFQVLEQLEDWLEEPVVVLGFIWLVLLVVELIWGLNPVLEALIFIIWGVFLLEFGVRLALAPRKLAFLRRNWLTVLSLLVPALRILRVAWFLRFLRFVPGTGSLRLVKVVGSLNRGMHALRASMRRRGFGYIALFTLFVTLVGSAGMYALEGARPGQNEFKNYGDALWFTAMIMTTMGSEYWPQTVEGRVLSFLLAMYSFTVFGYVTATLATYFIGRDAESEKAELAGERSIRSLQAEITALSAQLQSFTTGQPGGNPQHPAPAHDQSGPE